MKLEGWKGSWPTGSWDLETAANLNSGVSRRLKWQPGEGAEQE